jgi:hypothetical protein
VSATLTAGQRGSLAHSIVAAKGRLFPNTKGQSLAAALTLTQHPRSKLKHGGTVQVEFS